MTLKVIGLLPALALTLSPAIALAQTCADPARVAAAIEDLSKHYGDVLSDIGCDAPTLAAHRILCEDPALWDMVKLDTFAYVYAYENATGTETDRAAPPIDDYFIQTRDACTDAACLCDALKNHTNDSLGGTSPYRD
jgi:hypothetical protein